MIPAVPEPTVLISLGAGIVIVVIIAVVVYLWSRSRAGRKPATGKEAARSRRLDYQPAARPVIPLIRLPVPRQSPSPATPPITAAVSVVNGRTDIADSTRALAEKYSLDGFTLATTDGLVFSTSGNPTATEDAAYYGGTAPPEGAQVAAGVTLFTVTHLGSGLTGIIRSERPLSRDVVRSIGKDTQEILNRWI